MLLELQIDNFALIDKLIIEFKEGLNILTGETGAGKSIIIDSLNFVLGERSSKDIIRYGKEKAEVTATFDCIDTSEFLNIINEYGIDNEDNIIILNREINQSGRSICRINNKIVTSSLLKKIGAYLIDIHGQHEHQSLLMDEYHIELLDLYGGDELLKVKNEVSLLFNMRQNINKEIYSISSDDIEKEREQNLLVYQINEIDNAKLKINEEDELIQQKKILSNSTKLYEILSSCYNDLYENVNDDTPIYDKFGKIINEFNSIISIDSKLEDIYKSLQDIYYLLESSVNDIRKYKENIDFNPELLEEIENRLDLINRLKRKYGSTISEILSYRNEIDNKLKDIINSEEILKDLKVKLQKIETDLYNMCNILSDKRKDISIYLEKRIMNELEFLEMNKTKFKISFEKLTKNDEIQFSNNGIDDIKFLISTNPGEPLKPLSKIASGGEISRIMLALKIVFADTDKIPCLIFDEIDTGISGKAAQAVAEKLSQISLKHQVICVTHLPQIAAMANTHFYISKSSMDGYTRTFVDKLDKNGKINEIARMLGGVKLTEITLKHAEEMINLSQTVKNNI